MSSKKFKIDDRVKRGKGTGSNGTVKDLKTEVASTTNPRPDETKGLMVQVLWDNGTLSYLAPEALEVVKE